MLAASGQIQLLFYILSVIALFGGLVVYIERKYKEHRTRWKEEAQEKVELSAAIRDSVRATTANAEATSRNSAALDQVSRQMHEFITEVRFRLERHSSQLEINNRMLEEHQHQLAGHDVRLRSIEAASRSSVPSDLPPRE